MHAFRRPSRVLAFLQRAIEQLPAGDQVLQHGLQPCDVKRACLTGDVRKRRSFERRWYLLVVGFGEAKVDAIVLPIIIVVIKIDAWRK